jgi:hypothetical protein
VDQAAAKTAINGLQRRLAHRLTPAYAKRAAELIDDPDKVNQGYYGTCGPTAALRTLLLHDRAKFVNLMTAVFDPAQPVFNGVRVAPDTLYEARLDEIARKRAAYPPAPSPSAYQDTFDFDFIVGSSLYTFLKAADDRLFLAQRHYSESIVRLVSVDADQIVLATLTGDFSAALDAANKRDPDLLAALDIHADEIARKLGYRLDSLGIKDIRDLAGVAWTIVFTTDRGDREFVIERTPKGFLLAAMVTGETQGIGFSTGDMALDQDGIKALMSQVIGVRSAVLAERIDPSVDETVRKAIAKPNSYVFGLVKGYDEWVTAQNSPTERTFDRAAKPPAPIAHRSAPQLEHHLVILGITRNGEYNDVEVWSWGERFTVRIRPHHMGSYLYGYVHGQVV